MDARELKPESPGMTAAPNSYGGGGSVPSSSMMMPGMMRMLPNDMHLSFSPIPQSVSKPIETSGSLYHGEGGQGVTPSGSMLSMGETGKKKRGRPRKYGPDGTMALALSPLSTASGYSNSPGSGQSGKKRGRPLGSGRKQQLDALGSAGTSFTPHVITVQTGEDVASKIMSFSQQGPRTICILSANGAICSVTLRQPATSGGTVTYEGRFEIISLSGSFLLTENNGTRSRTGGLSVSLAGADGRVIGGGVAGGLMAATPVQVVVGSFIAEGKKPKPEPIIRDLPPPPPMPGFGAASVSTPPSQGTSSESSDDPGSLVNQSGSNSAQHIQSMPSYSPAIWSHPMNPHRDPDMKMMSN